MFELWNGALVRVENIVALSVISKWVPYCGEYRLLVLTFKGGAETDYCLPKYYQPVIHYRDIAPRWWEPLLGKGGGKEAFTVDEGPTPAYERAEANINALKALLTTKP